MRFLTVLLHLTILGISINASEDLVSHSQASQDKFVHTLLYKLLGKQDIGYYVEIGASEPITYNNTFSLEKDYGWHGLSIDISSEFKNKWQEIRKNPLIIADATQLNFSSILDEFPKLVDYLSLDIDGHYDTVLKRVIGSNHIFKIITIEHDAYRYGDVYRNEERKILSTLGYYLLCADVSNQGYAFEDWWIHPDYFPRDIFEQLTSLDLNKLEHVNLMNNIKSHMLNY